MRDHLRRYPLNRIMWIYNMDGKAKFFRIKGKDKRYFRKLRRREEKKLISEIVEQEVN